MKTLRRLLSTLLLRLWALPRMSRTDSVSMLGFTLVIEPGVFHPALFFSSAILAKHLLTLDLRDRRVLDMGTGSGILALCAARRGARVVALDVNPAAVQCAEENVRRNGLESMVRVAAGDLFDTLDAAERFDLIIWNPPFYPRAAGSPGAMAWNAGEEFGVLRRFAGSARPHLIDYGEILMIVTSDVDEETFFGALAGFRRTPLVSRRRFFETLTVYSLKPDA